MGVPGSLASEAWRYQRDLWQRSVLFMDILRERADRMLDHEAAGMPPVLGFPYEELLDARSFARPANYALVRISGKSNAVEEAKPPVLVVDPRAGHGPGIGGFKQDSEVGVALRAGHPVYMAMFFQRPCPGQTLADVHHALRRFVDEVARRHPGKPPVLYGNCQGGWAVALLSADCQGLLGAAVLNGSPLSYWAGESDVNPMRLAGGLLGGAWLAHFAADLAGGEFDGAWLVQNFELLQPGRALWAKHYAVFADPVAERERFLEFERWWGGYSFLAREEIVAIVENLFVGNRLERGEMRICEDCIADLKRIRNPLVVFASSADNITPPHQAMNWVPEVYPTTAALKAAGQRIVYLLSSHVGHLGIFVSGAVARREHRAILENVPRLEALAPGLYEMKIGEEGARFEERRVEDIRFEYPRAAFERVRAVSEWNEWAYATFTSPWVRAFASPAAAAWLKWTHPMRLSRYAFSGRLAPAMAALAPAVAFARAHRRPADDGNLFLDLERRASSCVSEGLALWRRSVDLWAEWLFGLAYATGPRGSFIAKAKGERHGSHDDPDGGDTHDGRAPRVWRRAPAAAGAG